MAILNYTTKIEAAKSIDEIQKILARHRARSITTDFDDNGNVSGIRFSIQMEGLPLDVRLPVNVTGVFESLKGVKGISSKSKTLIQARRVAWRILKDWLEAQLALAQIGQAEMAQVLMPYAIDSEGRSAYAVFRESHVRQLNAASGNVREGNFKAANE